MSHRTVALVVAEADPPKSISCPRCQRTISTGQFFIYVKTNDKTFVAGHKKGCENCPNERARVIPILLPHRETAETTCAVFAVEIEANGTENQDKWPFALVPISDEATEIIRA